MKRSKLKSGLSLFIAVVVAGVLLIIAVAVSDLATKENIFSSISKESEYAIFAADAGIECALYWDSKASTPSGSAFDPTVSGSSVNCRNSAMSTGSSIYGTTTTAIIGGMGFGTDPTSIFGFSLDTNPPKDPCAIVRVTKNSDGTTHVMSYGYNTCDTSNPRRVERGIEMNY